MNKRISVAAAVAAVLTATACGSGSGSDAAPEPPLQAVAAPGRPAPPPPPPVEQEPSSPAPSSSAAPSTAATSASPSPSATRSASRSATASNKATDGATKKATSKAPTRSATPSRKPTSSPPRPASKLDARCLTGRAICIDKTTRKLSRVVDGTVQYSMAVRFGSQQTPTREGSFTVYWKSRDHVSTIYDTPMPYALFFDGGQAVHFSADFAANGYNGASHGCVNVRDRAAAKRLFEQSVVGDKVIVHRS